MSADYVACAIRVPKWRSVVPQEGEVRGIRPGKGIVWIGGLEDNLQQVSSENSWTSVPGPSKCMRELTLLNLEGSLTVLDSSS